MTEGPIPPGRWLEQQENATLTAPAHLWGFGALHGGVTLAALTRAMQRADGEQGAVRSLTGRLHRPITGPVMITVSRTRPGRVTAEACDQSTDSILASASLVASPARTSALTTVGPDFPPAPPIEECELFVVPAGFVPISAYMQIRPVGPNRPYAGCEHPELTAWVRLSEDDRPPDLHRIIVLLDALAPSYAAILTTLQPIPTVELTVRPAPQLECATSPWILLRAVTISATADGWLHEHLDAWSPDGTYLASGDQLRTIVSPARGDQPGSMR
jgi:Thioesterase-like superfamily